MTESHSEVVISGTIIVRESYSRRMIVGRFAEFERDLRRWTNHEFTVKYARHEISGKCTDLESDLRSKSRNRHFVPETDSIKRSASVS